MENLEREIRILESNVVEFQEQIKQFDEKNFKLMDTLTNGNDDAKQIMIDEYINERQQEEHKISNEWLLNFDLIRKLYDIPYTKRKNIEDNIKLLRKDLKSLINKSQNGDIVIKKG